MGSGHHHLPSVLWIVVQRWDVLFRCGGPLSSGSEVSLLVPAGSHLSLYSLRSRSAFATLHFWWGGVMNSGHGPLSFMCGYVKGFEVHRKKHPNVSL
jgi:hypothetical protein